MKIYNFDKTIAKKNNNLFHPIKDTLIIILLTLLLFSIGCLLSFFFNNPILLYFALVALILIPTLKVPNYINKKDASLMSIVQNENEIILIKNNNLTDKTGILYLTQLVSKLVDNDLIYFDTSLSIMNEVIEELAYHQQLMKNESFIKYIIDHIDEITGFEIYKILEINDIKKNKKSFKVNCNVFDLQNNLEFKNKTFKIFNIYEKYQDLYNQLNNYKTITNINSTIDTAKIDEYKQTYSKYSKLCNQWSIISIYLLIMQIITELFKFPITSILFYCVLVSSLIIIMFVEPLKNTNIDGKSDFKKYLVISIIIIILSTICNITI